MGVREQVQEEREGHRRLHAHGEGHRGGRGPAHPRRRGGRGPGSKGLCVSLASSSTCRCTYGALTCLTWSFPNQKGQNGLYGTSQKGRRQGRGCCLNFSLFLLFVYWKYRVFHKR